MNSAINKLSTLKIALYGLLLLAFVMAPVLGAYPIFIMKVLCFVLFACAFNLLTGYTGLLSLGHAAMFGTAAYTTGHAMKSWGFSPELGVLAGVATSVAIGFLMGALAIRRQGIYFAMITLACAQMVYFFFLQASFTGGEDGLQGVPRGELFGLVDLNNDLTLYYVVLATVAVAFLGILRIVNSPFGQTLKAINENEPRAISVGYNTSRFKLLAFVLSAAFAGLAGSLKVLVFGFATLADVHWTLSGAVVLMTLIGGLGTLAGPIVGAFAIIALENRLGDIGHALATLTSVDWFMKLGESVTLITGLIFVVCVLTFRRGIVGEVWPRLVLRMSSKDRSSAKRQKQKVSSSVNGYS